VGRGRRGTRREVGLGGHGRRALWSLGLLFGGLFGSLGPTELAKEASLLFRFFDFTHPKERSD